MYKFKDQFLHASLGLLAVAAASAASAQTLFSATETASAGQPIVIAGDGFGPSTQLTLHRYAGNGSFDPPVSVPVTSQTAMTLGANVPSNIAFGIYSLTASTAGVSGNSVVVNAPRVSWASSSTASAGYNIRVVGRNLFPTTAILPAVRLVDTATGTSLPATVRSMSNYSITFTVPTGVVTGHSYTMMVNTGLAGGQNGSPSETSAPVPLTIQATGTDPYGLGVWWGTEFATIATNVYNIKTDSRLSLHAKGDGVTDDTAALQAAISYANQHGGGVVYLPTGSYNVDNGTPVNLYNKVVLSGDGYGSVLQVGYRFNATTPPSGNPPLRFWGGASDYGLYKLTIRNQNTSPTPNQVLSSFVSTTNTVNHMFMRYVTFELGNSRGMSLQLLRGAAMMNCTATSTSLADGPVTFSGTRELYVGGNSFNWKCGRIRIGVSARDVVENNTFQIDNTLYNNNTDNAGNATETGGIEASYAQDLFVSGNTFQGYGAGNNTKENEMFGAQRSTIPDYWNAGSVVSATSTTLVQANDWSGAWLGANYDPTLNRSYVAIVRGKGAGQMRNVVSHDTNSLTVDKPWSVTPDATSTYSVGSYIAYDQVFAGNTLSNQFVGIQWWDGAIDSVAANNTFTNCGSLALRAASESDPRGTHNLSQCLAWHNSILGNSLSSNVGGYTACISLASDINYDVALQSPMGSLNLDNSVVSNTIAGANLFRDWLLFRYDGIEVVDIQEQLLPIDPLTTLGYNVYGNTVTGSLMPYRYAL